LNNLARQHRRLTGLLLIIAATTLPSAALAVTAEELFADGNRLFRDDLYWAALLRYREAESAGFKSDLLSFNSGVANYKAEQYDRARDSFLKVASSPALSAHAHYNLGLNAWASGNSDEALEWFRQARAQSRFPKISALAEEAIARLEGQISEEQAPVLVRAEIARAESRPLGALDFRLSVGGGSDDNVFRAPAESYVDLSDPNLPVVDPAVQSGTFVPIALSAKYSINSFANESFFGAYRFGGKFFQDELLNNADVYAHELSFGTEYGKQSEDRERVIFSAFSIAQHDGTFFDRDDGTVPVVDDEEIGDRLNYVRYGPEIWFRQSFTRFSFGGHAKGQLWNYDETVVVPEYDHQYIALGMNAQYRFTGTSLLRITADVYKREFGSRPSFELDGTQPLGNPPVNYDYLALGVTARQRITRGLWFGLNFVRTDRRDLHVGYNDYIKNSFGADLHLTIGTRFDFEATAFYEVYDYSTAYAFHNPDAGRKIMERTIGNVSVTLHLSRHLSLVGAATYQDVASNDTRLAYNRNQFSLSIRWEQ
jgi:tetratricopeptide (TPR) repeat protein